MASPPRTRIQIDHGQAGKKEHRAPCARGQHGLAKVGLEYEQRRHRTEQQHGQKIAGHVATALTLGKEPGADDNKSRFHEFGRLDGNARK